jgi:glycosyltransferase involved in cell wall biosynthesis
MGKLMKVSVVIPHKDRLINLLNCIEKLVDQSLYLYEYEIIVGSLEKEKELEEISKIAKNVKIISNYQDCWNPSLARNIALAEASGETIILIDADIIVKKDFIEKHLAIQEKNTIIIGAVENYNENINSDGKENISYKDIRWSIDPNTAPLKWALCWTGNLSFSAKLIEKNFFFDSSFKGWGGEDLEWAYRLHKNGIKFKFEQSIIGRHFPHNRNVKKNRSEEKKNFDLFLTKWPDSEVNFVIKHGDIKANKIYFKEFVQNERK